MPTSLARAAVYASGSEDSRKWAGQQGHAPRLVRGPPEWERPLAARARGGDSSGPGLSLSAGLGPGAPPRALQGALPSPPAAAGPRVPAVPAPTPDAARLSLL